jgi:hypothetical protein
MSKLSHRKPRLSMLAAVAVAIAAIGSASAGAAPRNAYVGRWTVSDDKPAFSARGLLYRTIDIAPCGKDFCGVSVGKNGTCGPTLFRFLAKTVAKGQGLIGHGRWGNAVKNVEIWAAFEKESRGGRYLSLNLGDGHDFGERSGNMPKFSADYSPAGQAHCVAR